MSDIKSSVMNRMNRKEVTNFLKQYDIHNYQRDRKKRAETGDLKAQEVRNKSELKGYIQKGLKDKNLREATRRSAYKAVESGLQNSYMKSVLGEQQKPVKAKTMSGAVGLGAMLRSIPGAGAFLAAMKPKKAGQGSARFGPGSKKD